MFETIHWMKAAGAVVQQSSSGQPQTWRVLRELTTHGVTYLSGALFVEGSMFLRDSYATMCYFGQLGRVLSQNKWTEKRKKSPFISLYLHYVFQAHIRHYVNRYCPLCFNSTDKKHSGSNSKTVSSGEIHIHFVSKDLCNWPHEEMQKRDLRCNKSYCFTQHVKFLLWHK